ncbi:phosphopantetheine-binding protein [Flavobacterium caseinilyticum]|uniref:Acyl carrier protein n=1 Tax=Flavobacterium caseinilyticum TaxID=2541732 RepID=A0A4R5B0Q4_9FLAO|nr:phosphopantetheine-binding protein [Flavobacterium caseinilyticum]TDD77104.1 acyl carrier protein [Flavobacterium caseinilyticum]
MRALEEFEITKIKQVIADKTDVDLEKVTEDSNLQDHLGIDSLDIVEIIIELEEMFKCTIPDEDYEHTVNVKDLLKIVEQNL